MWAVSGLVSSVSGMSKNSDVTRFGIIVLDSTKPVAQLSEAADKLSLQHWDTPLLLHGLG